MKLKKIAVATGLVALLSSPAIAQEQLKIPEEPLSREKVVSMYLCVPSRSFIIDYDLDSDGRVDYRTHRRIHRIGVKHTHYVMADKPVSYDVDFNKDGTFDKNIEVFADISEDGINGNETSFLKYEDSEQEEI